LEKGEAIRMGRRFGLLMMVVAVGLLGCRLPRSWAMDKKGYDNISVDQFVEMMNHKDFILINVHIPYEGEIPETDLLIPFNAIGRHKNELPNDKATKIVVYCMTGPMGDIAAERLVRMGYTRVIHFQGGMRAWKKTGRPLLFRPKLSKELFRENQSLLPETNRYKRECVFFPHTSTDLG